MHRLIPEDAGDCKTFISSFQQQFSSSEKEATVILLALATSHSPAQMNDAIVDTVLKLLEPAIVVEIIVWLSVLQLLNRMSNYYVVVNAYQHHYA